MNHKKYSNKPLYIILLLTVFITSGFYNEKPKILIIGDSISIGYTPFVKKNLAATAIVEHNPGNAQHTGTGLKQIEAWIGDTNWDIIQFNWGLWDLCYRHPDSKEYGNRDKINGKVTYTVEEYAANLDTLVRKIKEKSNAKLVFVTTSYVPKEEAGRFEADAKRYNKAAIAVMKKHNVSVNHIYKASKTIHKKYGKGSHDVHYTKDGYKKLGKIVSGFLFEQLKMLKKQ
ncbi:SGNH/GDSL hydrolase family protein [Snuella sedimenti]|uniref:SGNH/GDSL hydrolase family protein n=1 Tax=Snuella sedimenti TaxID=2798802 RepID=A0A8J7LTV2_9FLAO|nr:SGNH/GDSL hydrolase family protein [Snuella sedimenti]MBJ6368781.1 SGNH/GDSL hydrolase family protein [Snuella sedimenti]